MLNGQIDNFTATIYTLKKYNFDFGLNDYPIFDENYRETLNNAILNYYMFHEIGFQNPAVFRHYLSARMDLIMRNKYNALYKAKSIEFNPLYNVEMHETFTRTVNNENNIENNSLITSNSNVNSTDTTNSTSENNSDNTASALSLHSNYPSDDMSNGEFESNVYVDNGQRQTNTTNNVENSSDSSTTSSTASNLTTNNGKATIANNGEETETYTKLTEGSSAGLPFSRAMIQLKDFYDEYQLDQQIIAELSDLFINVY